jgi:hypothetical protein
MGQSLQKRKPKSTKGCSAAAAADDDDDDCFIVGRAAWQLPVMEVEFPSSLDCYKWFACFLLEGCIFPKLKKYRNSLLSVPKTMVKTWAK